MTQQAFLEPRVLDEIGHHFSNLITQHMYCTLVSSLGVVGVLLFSFYLGLSFSAVGVWHDVCYVLQFKVI